MLAAEAAPDNDRITNPMFAGDDDAGDAVVVDTTVVDATVVVEAALPRRRCESRRQLDEALDQAESGAISNREMLEKMDEHFRAQLDELKCALRRVRAPLAHNR